eukprot:790399-Prymnesium_polylepis.1
MYRLTAHHRPQAITSPRASGMDGSAAGGEHSACLLSYSCAACWSRRACPLSARRMPLAM